LFKSNPTLFFSLLFSSEKRSHQTLCVGVKPSSITSCRGEAIGDCCDTQTQRETKTFELWNGPQLVSQLVSGFLCHLKFVTAQHSVANYRVNGLSQGIKYDILLFCHL